MIDSRIGRLAAVLAAAALLGGCGMSRTAERVPLGRLNFAPLASDEYEILGNAEGTATVGHFLIIPFGDTGLSGSLGGYLGWSHSAAMYKAIESVEGADALLAPRSKGKFMELLIFGTYTTTVKGKAIRILKK